MLMITRRVGEQIMVGNDIRITVVAIQKGRMRLGVTAPTSVPVMRQELRPSPSEAQPSEAAPPSSSP